MEEVLIQEAKRRRKRMAEDSFEWVFTAAHRHDLRICAELAQSATDDEFQSLTMAYFTESPSFLGVLEASKDCIEKQGFLFRYHFEVYTEPLEYGCERCGPDPHCIAVGPRSALMFTAKYVAKHLLRDHSFDIRIPMWSANEEANAYGSHARAIPNWLLLVQEESIGGAAGRVFDPTDLGQDEQQDEQHDEQQDDEKKFSNDEWL